MNHRWLTSEGLCVMSEQLDCTKASASELQDKKTPTVHVTDTCDALTEEAQQVNSPPRDSSVTKQTQEAPGGSELDLASMESTLEKKEELTAFKVCDPYHLFMLCCAVLCCAVLCCAVLCCVVL